MFPSCAKSDSEIRLLLNYNLSTMIGGDDIHLHLFGLSLYLLYVDFQKSSTRLRAIATAEDRDSFYGQT